MRTGRTFRKRRLLPTAPRRIVRLRCTGNNIVLFIWRRFVDVRFYGFGLLITKTANNDDVIKNSVAVRVRQRCVRIEYFT